MTSTRRQHRQLVVACGVAATLALLCLPVSAAPAPTGLRPSPVPHLVRSNAPASWPARRLAAQLVLAGVDMSRLDVAVDWAARGVGGIVLFGSPPAHLRRDLRAVRAAGSVTPLIASDEEGGLVQRLADKIYPLPSAHWMGAHWRPRHARRVAADYGARMRQLGVTMDLAPVADLLVPGHFIADEQRAFARRPAKVARFVNAWQRGLRDAGVVPTLKHWPGHGHAADTHAGLAQTPPWSVLKTQDVVPFDAALAAHAPVVMVGHLVVPGLTEDDDTPASLSRTAMSRLRARAGDATLIVTDSLSMGAIRTSLGLTEPQAAVRALRAGADMALVQDTGLHRVVAAISHAIRDGQYARAHAVASVERILAVKGLAGKGGRTGG